MNDAPVHIVHYNSCMWLWYEIDNAGVNNKSILYPVYNGHNA